MPSEEPILGDKKGSNFDFDMLDQQALEDQRKMFELIERQKNFSLCHFCHAPILPDDNSVLLQSTECFHSVHLACFKNSAREALTDNSSMFCPECGRQISVVEMRNYFDQEELEEIEKRQMQKLIGSNINLKKCPCGFMMEAAQGQIDYNVKDENGQSMSPAAAIHMSRYRIRCQSCENNFCHGCGVQPYHAGKNCEEYQRHANAKKCRFCGNELADQREEIKDAGAFADICLR